MTSLNHQIRDGGSGGAWGPHAPLPQILADQLTLSQPEGADYDPPPVNTCLPRFSDLPPSLQMINRKTFRHLNISYSFLGKWEFPGFVKLRFLDCSTTMPMYFSRNSCKNFPFSMLTDLTD